MASSIQHHPWQIISIDSTTLLNNMTNTELSILNVIMEIKKSLFYDTPCAF